MPFYVSGNKVAGNKVLRAIDKSVIPNHINASTTNRLLNKNSSTDRLIYSYQDPYAGGLGQFTRNPDCWLNGVSNISCFSPAQMSGYDWRRRSGTLVTRKHVLFARHFMPAIISGGTPLIFVDDNNNVIRRNLIQTMGDGVGETDTKYTDIGIGLLDQEVPENIKIAKVLPKNFSDYINISYTTSPLDVFVTYENVRSFDPNPLLYCVGLDQQEKAILKLWTNCVLWSSSSSNLPNFFIYQLMFINSINSNGSYPPSLIPSPQQYSSWSETIVAGDSGDPIFLIIDNELVVLTTWWTSTTGPFISGRYDQTNAIIEALSPGQGYSLTDIDLEMVYSKYM